MRCGVEPRSVLVRPLLPRVAVLRLSLPRLALVRSLVPRERLRVFRGLPVRAMDGLSSPRVPGRALERLPRSRGLLLARTGLCRVARV